MKIDIRTITLEDEAAVLAMNKLLVAEKETGNAFVESKTIEDFPSFYEKNKRLETETANPDWSTVTSYYAFIDGQVAGKISCRWELEKGNLAQIGGHIGYVTSPAFRQKGVMKKLLEFAFERYRERGINRIFITALAENVPSRRTIESVGGLLQDIIDLEDGKRLARYWVETGKAERPTFVWDLDGTLIDSYPAILRSLEGTYAVFDWNFDKKAVYDYILAHSVGQLLGEMAEQHSLEVQTVKAFFSEDLKKRDHELLLFSDTKTILEWTQDKGIQNFVYTHKGSNTEHVLKMLGISSYFTEALHSQSGFARKPDPEAMDYLVEKYSLDRKYTYYIGDRKLDMDFALKSQVQSINLEQPDSSYNHHVASLSEIAQLPIFKEL